MGCSSDPLKRVLVKLITFDLRSRASFNSLSSWLADARALASPDLAVVIVGNKLDQEEDRQVPYLEASRWAQEHGAFYSRRWQSAEG